MALEDMDGDRDLDLVLANGGPIQVLFNDSTGDFTASGQALSLEPPRAIALGDLDGDGDADVVEAPHSVVVVPGLRDGVPDRIWVNDGSGVLHDSGQALGGGYTNALALGDVDGDRDLDRVTGNDWRNQIWFNVGDGTFVRPRENLGVGRTRAVVLGDLDGDGDLDLVQGNFDRAFIDGQLGGQPDRVWFNDALGNFTDSRQPMDRDRTTALALGDLDRDGDLDLLAGNLGPSRLWLNNGSGQFTDSGQALGEGETWAVFLADLDGDGDLDAVMGSDGSIRIWLNDGLGNFAEPGEEITTGPARFAALGDVDGDGDLDLIAENAGFLDVWRNTLK